VSNPGCPACGTQTTLARWDDVNGFECGNCHGHFLPAPELAAFFESHSLTHRFERLVQNVRVAPESSRNLICTHCDASSFRTFQAGVVELDACAGCASLYFDASEATRYFRQARFKAAGGNAVKTGVETVEGASAIVDILHGLLP
jgi:Zn-finger nucleic acid-binding protein